MDAWPFDTLKVKKSWNLWNSDLWFLWILRVRVIWQMFQLPCMKEKWTHELDTIHDILRCLSLVLSLRKCRNAPISRRRELTHMRPSRTHGLTIKLILYYSGPLLATRSRPSCVAACDWSIVGGGNARLGPLRSHLGCSPTTGTIQNLYAIR